METVFVVTLGDAVGLGLLIVTCLLVLLGFLYAFIRQCMCTHPEYFENRSCHAICRRCGKDLGFLGTWREKTTKAGVLSK